MTRRAAAPSHGSTDLSLALSKSSGPFHTLLRTFDASLPADGTIAPSHPRTRRTRLLLALATVLLATVCLVPSSALGAKIHLFKTSFGAASNPSPTPANPYPLSNPSDVAVDESTGDIYVSDPANFRIEKFSPSGEFLLMFGKEVNKTAVEESATRSAEENVCPAVGHPGDTCQPGTAGTTPGAFESSSRLFVAVDNSCAQQEPPLSGLACETFDPSNGDVYVADAGNNTVSKFKADGTLVSSWGTSGQLSGLGALAGIAVDPSGNLFVLEENSTVHEYTQEGTATSTFVAPRGTAPVGLAVDAEGHLYKADGEPEITKFTDTGESLGEPDGRNDAVGLTVDPSTNDLYVVQSGEGGFVNHFALNCGEGCTPLEEFGAGDLSGPSGIAIDAASGAAYVANVGSSQIAVFDQVTLPDVTTNSASNVAATTATLNGHLDPAGPVPPDEVTDCHFQYVEAAAYNPNAPDPYSAGQTAPCAEGNSFSSPADVHADIGSPTPLTPNTTYHFRLQASNADGSNQGTDATFSTPPPPSIDAAAAANLTPTDADLTAQINPNGADTTYHFEWGTADCSSNPCTSVPVPDADIGAGTSDVAVSQHIAGLTANTTYHWRILATNAIGTVGATVDHTFIYDTTAGGLPDGRAYEMVTPPDKAGSVVSPVQGTVAPGGSSLLGASTGAFAGLTDGELPSQGSAYYSFTRTASGWTTTPLTCCRLGAVSLGVDNSVWQPAKPNSGVDHLFLRATDGSLSDIGPVWPASVGPSPGGYQVQAAASDASNGVVFSIFDQSLLWPFDTTVTTPSLYEYTGTANAAPTLVGVSGGPGSTTLISQCGTVLGSTAFAGSTYNVVSQNGQTVFFTALGANNHGCAGTQPPVDELFARLGGSQTVAISEPSSADCSDCNTATPADALFEGASADGSKVFFTTAQPLLSGDTDTTTDLYQYDFNAPAAQRLIQVSAGGSGDPTPGAGANVEGVSRISEDGSHVYFVADGVLTTDPNSEGQSAQPGANNLYVSAPDPANPGQSKTAFIAQLCSGPAASGAVADAQCPANLNSDPWNYGSNRNDQGLWDHGAAGGDRGGRQAQATPDGRFLVFTSYGRLTADDSSQAQQVFRYDAQSGNLARVSIGRDGFNDDGNANPRLGNASIVTGTGQLTRGGAIARTISDDGSYVFFQSPVGLTPQALDDVPIDSFGDLAQNVYEYHDGQVSLISDGKDVSILPRVSGQGQASGVVLAGTSASGADVFFTTVDPLVAQDTDTQVDIYDARIGGGFPPSQPPPQCQGDACQPLSGPPSDQSPGSAGFNGPGNPAPVHQQPKHCRKGKLLKHGKCVKKHHHKHRRHR